MFIRLMLIKQSSSPFFSVQTVLFLLREEKSATIFAFFYPTTL